jgi:hypothetical protein
MLIEFLLPTYNRVNELRSSLSSLICQTDEDWKATVILDYPEEGIRAKLLNVIHSFYDDRIDYIITDKRCNDWGHTPRQIAKQTSKADYILMTGDDNYYTPNFVKEVKLASTFLPGVIYWDMVHSHFNYSYFKCVPAHGQIDMGAFCIRRDIAQSIPLSTNYAADGDYIESIKRLYPWEKMIKIDKVMFVHN